MSSPPDNGPKTAVMSRCLPGSVASTMEIDRIRQFQKDKAERKAKEAAEESQKRQLRQEAQEARSATLHRRRMPGN
jgi:hypothetical protein